MDILNTKRTLEQHFSIHFPENDLNLDFIVRQSACMLIKRLSVFCSTPNNILFTQGCTTSFHPPPRLKSVKWTRRPSKTPPDRSVSLVCYITCHLADTFIQSDLQLIRLSMRHTPWSNVGLRALLKGPTAVQILSWPHQGSNHWVQVK